MESKSSRTVLRAEYRRRVFQVFNGDELMYSYSEMFFMQPEASNPTRDYADPGGTDARDMAVWRDGRILAVVRKGRDGRPEVIDFTADGAFDICEEGHR